MDTNPTEQTDQTANTEEKSNIVVESIEDDMRSHGIDVQEPKQEEEAGEPGTAEAEAKEDEQPKPKKKSRAQRKIERQARELKAKEEEIERLKNQGNTKESTQDEDPGKEAAVNPDDIDIDDFDTYEEYREAVSKAEEVANTKAEATNTNEEEKETDKGPDLPENLQERIKNMQEDGTEDYENFDDVVRNPELPLTADVLEAVTESEQAADIAYYLGTNLDRARKLAKMDKRDMAKEVLKIEIELETKPNKVARVSKAPDPINPVGGGNSSKAKSLDDNDLSYEEHEAILNKQKQSSRGGFL